MKNFFLILFFPLLLVAFKWEYTHDFVLKKDEVGQINIIKRDDSAVRVLLLRWTLYQNSRLVLLAKYDGFPTQYIIQKKYKRNSIKINLRGDYTKGSKRCYLILTFKSFDDAKKSALLKASIADPQKRIEIQFIDPKKSKG